MTPIRILHLSDLHLSAERTFDSDPALRRLRTALSSLKLRGLAPDVVALTGDITNTGRAEDYAEAHRWMEESLLPALPERFRRRRILMVPGNHDVERRYSPVAARAVQASLLDLRDQDAVTPVFQDPDERLPLLRRHAEFLNFANRYRPRDESYDVPWWSTVLELGGHRVHFAGLCSSWLSGGLSRGDSGKLLIGRWQVETLLADAEDADFSIALVHHPWSYLADWDAKQVQTEIDRRCHLVLRGHWHGSEPRARLTSSGACLELAAGRSHVASDAPTTFHLIDIEPEEKTIRVHFRLWYAGKWTADRNLAPPDGTTWFSVLRHRPAIPEPATQPRQGRMFLQRLRLTNFRCIRELELSFATDEEPVRKWTLLLGENGSGKSSVLRALALITAGSEALSELLGEVDDWIRVGEVRSSIEADLLGSSGEPITISLTLQRGDTLRSFFRRNRSALDLIDRAVASDPRSYFTAGYGCSRRLSRSAPTPGGEANQFRIVRAQRLASLFAADALLNPLQTWAVDLHYRRQEKGLAIIREAFRELLPGMEFDEIDSDRGDLIFRTHDGRIPLGQLSDGYQNMLAWCGDLLFHSTQLTGIEEQPLSSYGLLIIDEIDLHLHPLWQRQLRCFLDEKLPNFQIVATTHSPLTAQQAQQGELFALRRPASDQAPLLDPYEGEPRYLMVEELLTGSAFGVPSTRSAEVEAKRNEYSRLRDQETRTSEEEEQFQQLKQDIEELPDPDRATRFDTQHAEILQNIYRALDRSK